MEERPKATGRQEENVRRDERKTSINKCNLKCDKRSRQDDKGA